MGEAELSDRALSKVIGKCTGAISVSMSKKGCFLRADGASYRITETQAAFLFASRFGRAALTQEDKPR